MQAQVTEEAFAGIDVAFAKRKRLPIVVVLRRGGALVPLPLRSCPSKPPMGQGNVRILDSATVKQFSQDAVKYLCSVEKSFDVKIVRIAIDAPSDPRAQGAPRRRAEVELDRRRISCITTPDAGEFEATKSRARAHLASGGPESHLPGANQLWMLVGFVLFGSLRRHWQCLEVFPQAIVSVLGASQLSKASAAGRVNQLKAAAAKTGWPAVPDLARLDSIAYGSSSDKLDAYLAAWIASLEENAREPLGEPPTDAIWIPKL